MASCEPGFLKIQIQMLQPQYQSNIKHQDSWQKNDFSILIFLLFSKTCESFFMNFAFALRTELMLNVRLFSADIDLEENLES